MNRAYVPDRTSSDRLRRYRLQSARGRLGVLTLGPAPACHFLERENGGACDVADHRHRYHLTDYLKDAFRLAHRSLQLAMSNRTTQSRARSIRGCARGSAKSPYDKCVIRMSSALRSTSAFPALLSGHTRISERSEPRVGSAASSSTNTSA